MAFVVARRDGRFEIRESVTTANGPRSRTLATFRALTRDVLEQAAARARRPFDAARIRARAAELGAPRPGYSAAATARRLLGELRRGETLPPALAAELRRVLPAEHGEMPDSLEDAVEWAGVDDATRGRAARDLLNLASHLPQRRLPDEVAFPRIASEPAA